MAYSWLKARSTCGDVCVWRIGKSIWVLRSFFFFSNNTEPQTISGDHESSYHQASFVRNSMQAFGNSQNCFCLFFSTLLLSEFIPIHQRNARQVTTQNFDTKINVSCKFYFRTSQLHQMHSATCTTSNFFINY